MINKTHKTLNKRKIIILTLSSVILVSLAFPPFNLFLFAFIGFVPVFLIIYKTKKIKYLAIASSVFAVLFFGLLLLWVSAFMLKATEASVAILTLFTIIFLIILLFYFPVFIVSNFLSRNYLKLRWLTVPAAFAVMEYLRNVGFLGFPWGIISYSQWNFLPFIQIADTIGAIGISFLVYFSNAVIAHIIDLYLKGEFSFQKEKRVVMVFASVFIFVLTYGFIKIATEERKRSISPKTTVALIQKSFDPSHNWRSIYTGEPAIRGSKGIQGFAEKFLLKPQKFVNEEVPDGVTQNGTISVMRIARLAREAALSKPSLIVYPETVTMDAYGYYMNMYLDEFEKDKTDGKAFNYPGIYNTYLIYKMITETKTYNLLGTTLLKEDGLNKDILYYNGIEFIDTNGNVIDEYGKIKLVPGGEAYPFQNSKFFKNTPPFKYVVKFMIEQFEKAGAGGWEVGEKITVFNHPYGYKFAGIICYESAFGDFTRLFALNGAQLLNIITEDAWSYSDNSLNQHFYMAVLRAVENRRDTLQNGNSGVTGHISSTGKIISTLPYWKPGYMTANVSLIKTKTIYTLYGEWFILLCFLFIIAVVFIIIISDLKKRRFKTEKNSIKISEDNSKKKNKRQEKIKTENIFEDTKNENIYNQELYNILNDSDNNKKSDLFSTENNIPDLCSVLEESRAKKEKLMHKL